MSRLARRGGVFETSRIYLYAPYLRPNEINFWAIYTVQRSKTKLLEVLAAVRELPVLVVGDIILDRYVWGTVARISPEAPVPVVEVDRMEDRLGGAANVVRNLTALGCKPLLCGFIGSDAEGQSVLSLLQKEGVSNHSILVSQDKPTALKTRIIAQRQQMLRIDRESKLPNAASLNRDLANTVNQLLDSSKVIIASDYGKGAISEVLLTSLEQARQQSRIGMQQRPLVVDPHPANYANYKGICIAKPNRREAEIASGIEITDKLSVVKAANVLIKKWNSEMMLITLGEDGLAIVTNDAAPPIFLDTVAQEVFDVSGAGDTVTALFSAAIATGASPALAGDLANIAAGVVVSEVGTVPVDLKRLQQEIVRLSAA